MVPIGVLILAWISFKNKKVRKNALFFLVLICFPVIISMADKTYHKIKHGYFVNTPWTGIHLITPAFYVSDIEDESIFESKAERLFFKTTYDQLTKKNLNINHLNLRSYEDNISHYLKYFYISLHNDRALIISILYSNPSKA